MKICKDNGKNAITDIDYEQSKGQWYSISNHVRGRYSKSQKFKIGLFPLSKLSADLQYIGQSEKKK